MRTCSAGMVVLIGLSLSACGTQPPTAQPAVATNADATTSDLPAAESVAAAVSEIVRKDASDFKLGDYLPPLDGGRIEIATPAGWKPAPRDNKYVIRFVETANRGGLPRIDVIVEDQGLGGLTDVTEANVVEFTSAVSEDLEAGGIAIVEPPIPMVIGTTACARYVSHLKLKIGEGTILVERQTLDLLHAGRRYKINLLVMPNKLVDSRDAAYAVCAGIRFPETGE